MPLLPRQLQDYLAAPVPFIAGIHRQFLDEVELDDLVFVDLDKYVCTSLGAKGLELCRDDCTQQLCGSICVLQAAQPA